VAKFFLPVFVLAMACGKSPDTAPTKAGDASPQPTPQPKRVEVKKADAGPTVYDMVQRRNEARRPQPKVVTSRSKVEVRGGLTKEIVSRYVRRKLRSFSICVEKELLMERPVPTAVSFAMEFAPDGKATSVSTAALMESQLRQCLEERAMGLWLPKPKEGQAFEATIGVAFEVIER